MAKTPFQVEVLTPEGEAFNDEVQMVSTRTSVGSVGILNGHQPMLAMLDPTELRLYRSDTEFESFAQGEGFLQVGPDRTMLLVDELVPVGDLDAGDLQDRLRNAQSEIDRCEQGTEARRVAEREARRFEAFLKIAESGRR